MTNEQPENIREGAPYDDPRFEALAAEYGIWGTAESALCAVFWRAGNAAAAQEKAEPSDAVSAAVAVGGRIVPALGDRGDPVLLYPDQLVALLARYGAQPAAGEEIMVNAPGDVYTLPMQPSGLTSGPRFVVHVPAQPAASACVGCEGKPAPENNPCAVCSKSAASAPVAAQAQPKRRPYNRSGSLSEYGIFPECDAAQASGQPPAADGDAEDAARYRWLRKGESDDVAVVRGLGSMDYGMSAVVYTYSEEIDGDDLDATIDAAMRKESKQ